MKLRYVACLIGATVAASITAALGASPNVEIIGQSQPSSVDTALPGTLVLSRDGTFYGATSPQNAKTLPIFFNVTSAGNLTQLNTFGTSNGLNPHPYSMVEGPDGNFYTVVSGITGGAFGSTYAEGGFLRVSRDGVSSFIASFNGTGMQRPTSLISASDGHLYGIAATTGPQPGVAIFQTTVDGAITVLATIAAPYSFASIVEGTDANLYVTVNGGQTVATKLLRLTKSGNVSVLYVFDPRSEGYSYNLIVGPDGRFFGTIVAADRSSTTFFSIGPDGDMAVIAKLGYDLGLFGFSAKDSIFYGSRVVPIDRTGPGNTAVYKLTTSGVATLLHVYPTSSDPLGAFTVGADGQVYGSTWFGPQHRGGIFRLTSEGTSSYIYAFSSSEYPATPLVRSSDGTLYGMRTNGGSRHLGDIYRVNADGTQTTIAEFSGTNGRSPTASLAASSDGYLYGVTPAGGENDFGTVFRVTPAGEITTLASFTQATGGGAGSPTLGDDGSLYLVTAPVGNSFPSNGAILKLVPGGSLQTLFTFTVAEAFASGTPLTFGSDGKLYGVGVKASRIVSYSITTDGVLAVTHTFDSNADGYSTVSKPLVLASTGYFYYASNTAVFRLALDGEAERLASVNLAGFTVGSDGNLYGTTIESVPGVSGRIVRVTPNGVVATVATFSPADGTPGAALVEGSDHRFYGLTDSYDYFSDRVSGKLYRATVLVPEITDASVGSDGRVTIRGTGFTGTTRVVFGGVSASYSVDADSVIRAMLPPGASANALSVTTPAGIATFPAGAVAPGPVLNISTRSFVVADTDLAMIGGFIVQSNSPKKVIIRAIGPSLTAAGVDSALADPVLELHDGSGKVVATNDNWQDSADKQLILDTGIPPADAREAAIVRTLEPGNYTAVVTGAGNTSGVSLVEVYDLDGNSGKLVNISTRAKVFADGAMIGGFIVGGDAVGKVLVRAIGPSLLTGPQPVQGAIADPTLELRDGDGNLMASNDNWQEGGQANEIADTTIPPSDMKESAIVASLVPGTYTAIVRGVNNSAGVALIEVYKLD